MNKTTFCYFGLYKSNFSVNKITIEGLRHLDCDVLECHDNAPGLKKYFNLYRIHREMKDRYDFLIVGFPGHVMVPFARSISSRPIVADLIGSLADAELYSHKSGFVRRLKNTVIDWLAVQCADVILLESQAQKKHFEKRFGQSKKYHVVYTGASESDFSTPRAVKSAHQSENISHANSFTVLFRGSLTPESGIFHILQAALIMKDTLIKFLIIGRGVYLEKVRAYISEHHMDNVQFISDFIPQDELRTLMQSADISLGQFESNPRLDLTIPHKAFESFALGVPYLSGDAPAVREVVKDGETGFLCPLGNPQALADTIVKLSENNEKMKKLLQQVADNAQREFIEKYSSTRRAEKICEIVKTELRK